MPVRTLVLTKVRHHGKIVFDHESIARNGLG